MGAKAQIEEMRNGVGRQRATLKSDYNNIDTQFKEQLMKTNVRDSAANRFPAMVTNWVQYS